MKDCAMTDRAKKTLAVKTGAVKGVTHIWMLSFVQAGLAGMAKAQAISDAAAHAARLADTGLRLSGSLTAASELTGRVTLRAR
jgi:hypothetical protein